MALPAHSGPRPVIQFRNNFSQIVGLFGRVISPSQGRYLKTGQHKHRINAHTNQIPMPWVGFESKIRTREDISCLRLRGYSDRLTFSYTVIVKGLDVEIFTDLHVLSPPEYERLFLECQLYVRTCASAAPERLDGLHSYSMFFSLSITGRCPLNMNSLANKLRPSHRPQIQFSRKHI
jgi:hypothetical protein